MPRGETSYPLSPVDHVLLVTHESLRRRGYCGLNVLLAAEVEGRLEAAALAGAIGRLMRRWPILGARLEFGAMRRRPRWVVGEGRASSGAAALAHRRIAAAELEDALSGAIDEPIDLARGPQVRVHHFELSPERHCVALKWEHPFMDMEGGHVLLRALDDVLKGIPPRELDESAASPPAFASGLSSWWRTWQGRVLFTYYDGIRQPRVVSRPEDGPQTCRVTFRHYDAARRAAFEAAAKRRTADGPMRYTRAALVAAARAYFRMASERGRPRPSYVFPQPFPLARVGGRPALHGNHVVVAWIVFKARELASWEAADASASRQLANFVRRRRDAATWRLYRAAARWPLPWTLWVAKHRFPRAAAGFTGYPFDDSVSELGSAKIVNLYGAGSMNCHPGWLVGRTTYGDRMSVSVTYFEDYIDAASVEEYLNRLEGELFDA